MTRQPVTFALLALILSIGCRQTEPVQPSPAPEPPPAEIVAPPAEEPQGPIKNARTPMEGLLTGGQITEQQLEETAAAGYRTVVNLRPLSEEGAWDEGPKVTELGMRYVHIPVAGAADINEENARRMNEVISDPEALPAIVHCASGNRVGALFALKAFHIDGADAETALGIGREAGLTKLEETVKEILAR
ncbi:MAG: hypothetical protein GY719_00075 [bacterium]|nr:hypothetical protein [bacterium]